MPPHDVQWHSDSFTLENQSDNSVVIVQMLGACLTREGHLGISERRNAILTLATEDLLLRDVAQRGSSGI